MGIVKKMTRFSSAFISMILAILLALMLIPVGGAQSAHATTGDRVISDQEIEALLASGDYVPGEAIIVVDEMRLADTPTFRSQSLDLISSAETLITASANEYEQTVEAATISDDTIHMLSSEQNAATGDTVSVRHITNSGLSTAELLYQLRDDPRVLSVEPNYIYQNEDPDGGSPSSGTQAIGGVLDEGEIRDLTDYQWGNSNAAGVNYVAGKTAVGFDIGSPDWESSRTTEGEVNATGTVAILDSGIDHTNPDLKNIVRNDMKDFVIWGGEHGYCPWDTDPGDTMDRYLHGTHCAGIVASEWNDFGTSGVASGVKLVAVKAGYDDGRFDISNVIKGYDYLAEAMKKNLDLKAINNSWGGTVISRALSLAVTKLGNLGAISVFASGNESKNADNVIYTFRNLSENPYAVVVDASDAKALLSKFSNYGSASTNIVAPGTGILSTYPLSKATYMPDAVQSSSNMNIVYENFGTSIPKVKVYKDKDDAFLSPPGDILGTATSAVMYDKGTSSWAAQVGNMGVSTSVGVDTKCLYFTLKVPDSEKQDLKYLGLYTNLVSGSEYRTYFDVSILCLDGSGNEQWATSDAIYESTNDWGHLWMDIEEKCASDNLVPYYRGSSSDTLTIKVAFDTHEGDPLSDNDLFCFDAVGLGRPGSLVPYAYNNGTSLAAPSATGAAAVLATLDDPNAPASEQAKLRAARLEGSVRPLPEFSDKCTSGGALDLRVAQSGQYSPVLQEATVAQVQDSVEITLSGYFFGATEGSVQIGGVNAPIKQGTWSDRSVTVICPSSVSSGMVEISLTSSLPKTGKMTRLLELPSPPSDPATPLFEREYALPFDQGFATENTEVPLIGLGGFLYAASLDGDEEITLWKLDPSADVWTKCPPMPGGILTNPVNSYSATTYDGKVYVTGSNVAGTQSVLYSYDPQTNSWTDQETSKIPLGTTLVNCNEKLLAVGGINSSGTAETDAVSIYDPTTDTLTQKATLTKPGSILKAAVHGSKILVAAQNNTADGFGLNLVDIDTGEVKDLTSALPTFDATRDNYYSVASTTHGFVLCGASATTGANATTLDDQDTYLLDIASLETGATFEALGKRASHSQLFTTSATSHRGTLYAYGASYYEKDGYALRATEMQTLPQPGDLYSISYHNSNPGEHNNPAAYSPTSLPLKLNNAQNRESETFAGWHTTADFSSDPITELPATTTGDVELWAQWKTDTPPTPTPTPTPVPNPSGNGKALLSTGDALPIAMLAFTALALLAGAPMVLLARKRGRYK